jgi:hypothetical protein
MYMSEAHVVVQVFCSCTQLDITCYNVKIQSYAARVKLWLFTNIESGRLARGEKILKTNQHSEELARRLNPL